MLTTARDGNPFRETYGWNESIHCSSNQSWNSSANEASSTFSGLAIQDIRIRTLFIVIGIAGILGNSLVAFVLLRFTNIRTRLTNIYIVNQSLVDCIASAFLLATTAYQDESIPPGFAGELKCRLWLAKIPFWSMMMSSAVNLIAITVERYFKVVHPLIHRSSFTFRKALITVIIIWLIGPVYQFTLNVSTSAVVNGQCFMQTIWPNDYVKMAQTVLIFTVLYIAPISVFAFCYTKMGFVLYRGHTKVAPATNAPGTTGNTKPRSTASKRALHNIVKTMIVVSVAFFICTSMNQWLFFLFSVGLFDYSIFSNPIYNASVIMFYMNCCVNPVIYVAGYHQVGEAMRHLMRRRVASTAAPSELTLAGTRLSAKRAENVPKIITAPALPAVSCQ